MSVSMWAWTSVNNAFFDLRSVRSVASSVKVSTLQCSAQPDWLWKETFDMSTFAYFCFFNVCGWACVWKSQQCLLWFTIGQVGRLLCQGFHVPMLCTARGPWHSKFYKLLLDARFLTANDILEAKLTYLWEGWENTSLKCFTFTQGDHETCESSQP